MARLRRGGRRSAAALAHTHPRRTACIGVFGGARSSGDEVVRAAQAALAAAERDTRRAAGRRDRPGAGRRGGRRPARRSSAAPLIDAPRRLVRIDAATARLLAARFVVEGEDGEEVLLAEREADDLPQTLLGKRTTCVGRDRELAVLEGICAECVARAA